MGDIDIEIEIEGVEKVGPALMGGLGSGLEESGDWALKTGEDKAKNIILSADREWRKTLKRGFSTKSFANPDSFHGRLQNSALHAEIVEDGLKPGNSPPVQRLLPWIDDRVTPNAEAQATAESANPSNWDPELQAAAAEYGPAKVITAFAIKGKLEKKGYPGIHFMETTEQYLQQIGPPVFRQKIEKHMNRALREAGLK